MLIDKVTSNYRKDQESNVYRLMLLIERELLEMKSVYDKIDLYRDIDRATGKTLDRIGENIGEPRGGKIDQVYRLFIKSRVTANRSPGDVETLNEVLRVFMGDSFIGLREHEEKASIIVVYRDLVSKIIEEFQSDTDNPWFFDGTFLFNGERNFDGGLSFDFAEFEQAINQVFDSNREIVNQVKAAGVKVYFEEPYETETEVNINHRFDTDIESFTQSQVTIENSASFTYDDKPDISPTFYFDGLVDFDGTLLFDAKKPVIIHDVTITEESA